MSRIFQLLLLVTMLTIPVIGMSGEMADIHDHPACSYCGMKRQMFPHSRMLITYSDHSQVSTCSIHCTAVEFSNQIDKMVKKVEVGDYDTKNLIDARTAVWVMGGDIPGVMTKRPKWAFADEAGARAFVAGHGGEMVDFDRAMQATFEDMYKDTEMIRKKRSSMGKNMKGGNHKHQ